MNLSPENLSRLDYEQLLAAMATLVANHRDRGEPFAFGYRDAINVELRKRLRLWLGEEVLTRSRYGADAALALAVDDTWIFAAGKVDGSAMRRPDELKAMTETQTMKLPEHKCGLFLTHNEHRDYYQDLAHYMEEHDDLLKDLTPEDRAECLRTDELWQLQWYPSTPTGFNYVAGPTLERVLELANG